MRTSEYAQLVAQRKMLEEEVSTRGQSRPECPDRPEGVMHACRMASNRANVNDILRLGRDIGEAQAWPTTTSRRTANDS